jgi:hypothetical protein
MKTTDKNTKLCKADLSFLEGIAGDVAEMARVRPNEKVGDFGPNTSGGTLIRPGGRKCYPAFWIRDFAMSLESGLITVEEQKHALLYTAQHQQEGEMTTASGSIVPHGSIVDHISFDGKAIFFPGTIDDYQGQGGIFGKRPCYDDHFYFIHMAWYYLQAANDVDILSRKIKERSLIERLDLAFSVSPVCKDSHIICCDDENRGVSFGFCDSIVQTGKLLFCSLLKYRAAGQMFELHKRLGNHAATQKYADTVSCLKQNITATFSCDRGLLRASTGTSSQPDVWGSAFAVYIGAVEEKAALAIGKMLADAYIQGTLAFRGNIRHVLTTDDFSDNTAWELTVNPGRQVKNRYQNGAYWNTPTGWVCYAIALVDKTLAAQLAGEYIDELRDGDFRKGPEYGSPWECIHPDGDYKQNPVYLTSVACPLAAFRKIDW